MQQKKPGESDLVQELLLIAGLVAVSWIAVSIRPVGFMGGGFDDIQYVNAAAQWMQDFPYVGTTHWALRHPFVLQLVALLNAGFKLPSQLLIISFVWYGLVLSVAYVVIRALAGVVVAFFSCLMIGTSPVVVELATSIAPDLVEFCLVLGAVSIVLLASQRKLPSAFLVISGLLLGLAWLTRETAGAAILLIVMLFVFRPTLPTRDYVLLGMAIVAVIAAETIWLWSATGDVLYRMHVDMRHVLVPSAHLVGGVASPSEIPILNPSMMSRWVGSSPIKVAWFLDPYLAFFTDRQFGVIFVVLPAVAIFLWRQEVSENEKVLVSVLAQLGILSFLFSTYVLSIRPQARYYLSAVFAACVVLGVFLGKLWFNQRKSLCAVIAFCVVVANLLLCDMQQYRNYARDALVKYVSDAAETISVSRLVWDSVNNQVFAQQFENLVIPREPEIGDMLLISEIDKDWDSRFVLCNDSSWREYIPRPFVIGMIIRGLGLQSAIPNVVLSRVLKPNGVVRIGRRCG